MRILHVIPSVATRTGGPATSVVDASLALVAHGFESAVYATDMSAPAGAGRRRRISPEELPSGAEAAGVRLFPPVIHRFAYAPTLRRAIRSAVASCDVVHVHSLYLYPQLAAFLEARSASVPYVVSPRGSLDPFLRARSRGRKAIVDTLWQGRLLAGAASLHVTSEGEREATKDIAPCVPRFVVPNCIRWDDFHRLPTGTAFRDTRLGGFDGPLIGVHGRINFKKGLDRLIRAFSYARLRVPDARLVIAGPDDEGLTPRLKEIARELGVEDAVSFIGMLGPKERLEALAAFDLWALPSHTENFGNAAVEAMAAGLPVLLTPDVAIARAAFPSRAAAVSPGDPENFGAALAQLLADPREPDGLRLRGRNFAKRYDWAQVAPRLAAMYEQAAG